MTQLKPTSVRAVHPRHPELDGYHPAFINDKDETWYAEFIISSSRDESEKISESMLNMKPVLFHRMTVWKLDGPFAEIIDYTPEPLKYPVRNNL